MLRSFFIITLRIIWRNKGTSFINIASLAIGMAAFIFIMLYVYHEYSHDRYIENYDRIYKLEGDYDGKLPPIIGEVIKEKVPEVESVAKFAKGGKFNLVYINPDDPEDTREIFHKRYWIDTCALKLISLEFVKGSPRTAFLDPFSEVLTESTAKRLFGDEDPMGKVVRRGQDNFTITGVIKDARSHLAYDALVPYELISAKYPDLNLNEFNGKSRQFWSAFYLLLHQNAEHTKVEQKINAALKEINTFETLEKTYERFHLIPLEDMYFRGATNNQPYGEYGNIKLIKYMFGIAILILALPILNYINLTTARATLRLKEVALKKIVGSGRKHLNQQFVLESIIFSLVSFFLAFTFIQLLLPEFNRLAMTNLGFDDFNTTIFWLSSVTGAIVIGIISGFYPSSYITSIDSVALFKGNAFFGTRGIQFRGILLTFQFSICLILIIGIFTNLRQLHFEMTKDLGYKMDHVIRIQASGDPYTPTEWNTRRRVFKERLLHYAGIRNVAFSSYLFLNKELPEIPNMEIEGNPVSFLRFQVDPDYFELLDIDIVEGRGFSSDRIGDNLNQMKDHTFRVIFNETAVKEIFNESPVGKTYNVTFQDSREFRIEVIGIVEDHHYRPLQYPIQPLFFTCGNPQGLALIKIAPNDIQETLKNIKNEWDQVFGHKPLRYDFYDEAYYAQYKKDEQTATLIGYFTILAIIIACMGLFASSSFMAMQRTKEIGIRKALGASSKTIFVMLSREYIKWIMLSALIASPIAWFGMNKWLETFAYHIELGPGVFILATILALAIGLITVSWQSIKSALTNPVKALRYE